MTSLPRAAALAVAALALGGCPLPQPLPVVQRSGATVTPPRIVVGTAQPATATVAIRPDCPSGSVIPFGAQVEDLDLDDTVEARWFVDYTAESSGVAAFETVAAAVDGASPLRPLRTFSFEPAVYGPSGTPHVVEVVVSNGFHPQGTAGLSLPNRTAVDGYETQIFRWFVVVDPAGRCE